MTLLQERDEARRQRRLQVLAKTRAQLKVALAELIPGQKVILFGSITKPGTFNDRSDIDLALETEPLQINAWRLASELADHMGRRVDVVLLPQCRFREKILREGEVWIA